MFKRNRNNEPGKLLFDYFEGQTGLPVEPGHDEIILTATDNSQKLQMDVYFRPTGDNETESSFSSFVIYAG